MIDKENTTKGSTDLDDSPKSSSTLPSNNGQIQLWQFLLELLCQDTKDPISTTATPSGEDKPSPLKWEGETGEFRIMDPDRLADLWGQRKRKPNMNYDKLTRAIRYYYEKNIITKIPGKRFSYRFDIYSLLAEGYTIPSHINLPPTLTAYPPSPTFLSPTALVTAAALDQRLWLQAQQGSPSLLHTPTSVGNPFGFHSPAWASGASTPSDSFSSGSPSSPSLHSTSPTSMGGSLPGGYYHPWASSPPSVYHHAFLSSGLVHYQDPQHCYSACANLGNLSRTGSMSPTSWMHGTPPSGEGTSRRTVHGVCHRYSPY